MSTSLTGQFASPPHAMNHGAGQNPNSAAGQPGVHPQLHQDTALHANAGGTSQQKQKSLVPLAQPKPQDTFKAKPASLFSRFVPSVRTLNFAASAQSLQAQLIRRICTRPTSVPVQSAASRTTVPVTTSARAANVTDASKAARTNNTEFSVGLSNVISGAQAFAARTSAQAQSMALRGAAAATALMASRSAFADDVRPYVPTEPTSNFSVDFMNFMASHDLAVSIAVPVGIVSMLSVSFVAGMATGGFILEAVRKRTAAKAAAAAAAEAEKAKAIQGQQTDTAVSTQIGSQPAPTDPAKTTAVPPTSSAPQSDSTTSTDRERSTTTTSNASGSAPTTTTEAALTTADSADDVANTPIALADVRQLVDDKVAKHPSNLKLQKIQAILHDPSLATAIINLNQLPADQQKEWKTKLGETLNELQSIMSQMANRDGQGDGGNDSTDSEIVEQLRREISGQRVDPAQQLTKTLAAARTGLEALINNLTSLKQAQSTPPAGIVSAIANFRLVLSSIAGSDAGNDLTIYIDTLDVAVGHLESIEDRKIKQVIDQYITTTRRLIDDLSRHAGLIDTHAQQTPRTLAAVVEVLLTPSSVPVDSDSSGLLSDDDLLSIDEADGPDQNSDPALTTLTTENHTGTRLPGAPADDFEEQDISKEGDAPTISDEDAALHQIPSSTDAAADGLGGQSYIVDPSNARVDASGALTTSQADDGNEPLELDEAPEGETNIDRRLDFTSQQKGASLAKSIATEVPLDADADTLAVETSVDDSLLDDLDDDRSDRFEKKKALAPTPDKEPPTLPTFPGTAGLEFRVNNQPVTGSGQSALVYGHDGTPSDPFATPPGGIAPPAIYDERLDPNFHRDGQASGVIVRTSFTEAQIMRDAEVAFSKSAPRALKDGDKCIVFHMGDPLEVTWNEKEQTLSNANGYPIHGPVIIRQLSNPNLIQGVLWPKTQPSTPPVLPVTREFIGHLVNPRVAHVEFQPAVDDLPPFTSTGNKTIILKAPESVLSNDTHFKIKVGVDQEMKEYRFSNGEITPVDHTDEFPKTGKFKAWQSSSDPSDPAETPIAYIRDGVIFSSQRWFSGDHGDFSANTPEVARVMEQLIQEERTVVKRVNSVANYLQNVGRIINHYSDWITETREQFDDLEMDRHSLYNQKQATDILDRIESRIKKFIDTHNLNQSDKFANEVAALKSLLEAARTHIESFEQASIPARVFVLADTSKILDGLLSHDEWRKMTDDYGVKFHFIWVNQALISLATQKNISSEDAKVMSAYIRELLAIDSGLLKKNLPVEQLSKIASQLHDIHKNITHDFDSVQDQFRITVLGEIYEDTLSEMYDNLKTYSEDPSKLATYLKSWSEALQHASILRQIDSLLYDDVASIQKLVADIETNINDTRLRQQSINKLTTVLYVRRTEIKISTGQINPETLTLGDLQKLTESYLRVKTYARTLTDAAGEKVMRTINNRITHLNNILDHKLSAEVDRLDIESMKFNNSSPLESVEEFKTDVNEFKDKFKIVKRVHLHERIFSITDRLESLIEEIKKNKQSTTPQPPIPNRAIQTEARPRLDVRGANPDVGRPASATIQPARPVRPAPTQTEEPATIPASPQPIYTGDPDRIDPSGASIGRLVDGPYLGGIKQLAQVSIDSHPYQIFYREGALKFANQLFRDLPTKIGPNLIFCEAYKKLFEMLKNPAEHSFLYTGMDLDVAPEHRHLLAMAYLQVFFQSLALSVSGLKTEFRFKADTQEPVLVLVGRKSNPDDTVYYFDLLGDKHSGTPHMQTGKLKNFLQESSSSSSKKFHILNPGN